MTNETFYRLFSEAVADPNREAFVSDWTLSSIWGDDPEAEIPAGRITQLGELWDAAHRSIKDIADLLGISMRQLAMKHGISYHTAAKWNTGEHNPPPYILLLLQEAEGIKIGRD